MRALVYRVRWWLALGALLVVANAHAQGSSNVVRESGSFTTTWDTACTTSPTWVWDYQRVGNIVTLYLVGGTWTVSCASDSADVLATTPSLPATIRPLNDTWSPVVSFSWQDNSTAIMGGCVVLFSDGEIRLVPFKSPGGCQAFNWTSSGNKLATAPSSGNSFAFSYMLGNP